MVFKTTGFIQRREIKSRRDGILLTVDLNLRTVETGCIPSLPSPAGTAQWKDKMSSLQDLLMIWQQFLRRLKSTVNKVLSLRDAN